MVDYLTKGEGREGIGLLPKTCLILQGLVRFIGRDAVGVGSGAAPCKEVSSFPDNDSNVVDVTKVQ